MNLWLLPPNPGPFGSLQEWTAWRDQLRALGPETPGIDAELDVAEDAIRSLTQDGLALEAA